MFRNRTSHIIPFQREAILISLYEACGHRPTATSDAAALTDTVLAKLIPAQASGGSIDRSSVITITSEVLKRFDAAAYMHYSAYHPL